MNKSAYQCYCKADRIPLENISFQEEEHIPLADGRHTAFSIHICSLCGMLRFLPQENWNLFVAEGPPELVADWERECANVVNYYRSRQSLLTRFKWWLRRRRQTWENGSSR